MQPSDLHVVAVFNNPRRWKSRVRLLNEFLLHMRESGISLTLVDHAFGEREHAFAKDDLRLAGINHVQVRGGADQEIWLKEALQKVGVRTLPDSWRYLAIIDADVRFERRDWAMETLHMLQHHCLGQPWSHSIDLAPDRTPLANEWSYLIDRSFAAAWTAGDVVEPEPAYGVGQPQARTLLANQERADARQHYGYAWAFRRETWDAIGGLPDWIPTGAADYHASLAFGGSVSPYQDHFTEECRRRLRAYAELCDQHVKQDLGVVPGILIHGFHGSKQKRHYITRDQILAESKFDPNLDLRWDWQGIPSLARDNRILRDGLRRMNTVRDEDSADL